MSGILILAGAGVLGSVLIVAVGVTRLVAGGRAVRDPHGLGPQLAGLLGGATLAVAAWFVGPHHELILAMAPLAGSCWLVGLIVAERGRERLPAGPLRVAGLGPRTVGGVVSRHALTAMRGTFLATGALAGLAILLTSDKDARGYTQSCLDGTVSTQGWPSAPYAVPALVGLALGWALAEWAIRCVVRRPPGAGRQAVDGARRILAARTAVTAAVLLALPTLGALLMSMGAGVHGACPTGGENALSLGMLWSGGLLALASAGGWVAALLSGGRSVVPRVLE
ncbi:MAG: hypothetical protein WKF49_07185 [Thermoleophilaceae bacterium]